MAIVAPLLGIRAISGIFSVVNKVILNPLSYSAPSRLVNIDRHIPEAKVTQVGSKRDGLAAQ